MSSGNASNPADTSVYDDEVFESLVSNLHSVLDYPFIDNSPLGGLDAREMTLLTTLPTDANGPIPTEELRALQYVLAKVEDVMDRAQTLLYYLTTMEDDAEEEYTELRISTLFLLQRWQGQRDYIDSLWALLRQQEPESLARFIAMAYLFPIAPNV